MIALKAAYVTLHLCIYPYKACAQSDWQGIKGREYRQHSEGTIFTLESTL